jgi:predicted phosphoribosyltransferase
MTEESAGAENRVWVVDRIEGETVVLVDDASGRTAEVARSAIGVDVREGTVLRVPISPSGTLAWLSARADEDERGAREREARDMLDDLRGRDPGGDVDL